MPRPRVTPEVFWSRIEIRPSGLDSPCWVYLGKPTRGGYAQFERDGQRIYAHREAWRLAYSPIPEGMDVLHRCDNPPCVRPSHLFLGTHQDNMDDKAAKGRASRLSGESNPFSKLTREQVDEIRAKRRMGRLQATLAGEYGVSLSQINNIVNNRQWREEPA